MPPSSAKDWLQSEVDHIYVVLEEERGGCVVTRYRRGYAGVHLVRCMFQIVPDIGGYRDKPREDADGYLAEGPWFDDTTVHVQPVFDAEKVRAETGEAPLWL